jgi:TPR repeat protein
MRRFSVLAFALLLACGLAGAQADKATELERTRVRAESGIVSAQLAMGRAYFLGEGVPKDEAEGLRWFRKAAEKGEAQSERILGLAYEAGQAGLSQDDTKAAYWFRKAADHGDAVGQSKLAQMYETGRGGLPKDGAEALRLYRKVANRGIAAAQNKLGDMYEYGRADLPKDEVQALYWYRKAADQDDVMALSNAARLCLTSQNSDIRSPMAALNYARKAASIKKDDPEVLHLLARAYYVEGQFEDAVQTQLQALNLAPAHSKAEYQQALDEYQRSWQRSKAIDKKSSRSWPSR